MICVAWHVQAVAFGAAAVSSICTAVEDWGLRLGKAKREARVLPPAGLQERIKGLVGEEIEHLYRTINGTIQMSAHWVRLSICAVHTVPYLKVRYRLYRI
jgi:hypothetical protein